MRPEFAGDHDERFFSNMPRSARSAKRAAIETLSFGKEVLLKDAKVLVVGVPVGMLDADAPHPGFDQAARHNAGLTESCPAIGVAKFFRLLTDIEGFFGLLGCHEIGGALGEDTQLARVGVGALLGGFLEAIDLLQQATPVVQTRGVDGHRRVEIRHGEVWRVWISLDRRNGAASAPR